MDYKLYLESDHWQTIREQYAMNDCNRCKTARWACVLVYGKGAMHVHHLNYDHLGCERPEDLEVLCWRCHELEHFKETQLPKIILQPCPYCNRPKIILDPPVTPREITEPESALQIIRRWNPHKFGTWKFFHAVPASEKLREMMLHPTCRIQQQLQEIQQKKRARWPHLIGKGIAPNAIQK